MASEAWSEMLVRRRSSTDAFQRTPSVYDGITKEELAELKALYFLDDAQVSTYITSFQKYDADKSGDIDSKEIVMLLRDLGLNFPEADVYDMIQAVDIDGSGTIGVPEFIALIADPDGPLGTALADDSHATHVDPRQAWLRRKHLEVKIKKDLLTRSSRANFVDNLQLRINKFSDAESGLRGWAGFAGCAAVAMSEKGLLLAAADGGGVVQIYRKFPDWEGARHRHDDEDGPGPLPLFTVQDLSARACISLCVPPVICTFALALGLELEPASSPAKGMSFSPTSSYAGSASGRALSAHAANNYQLVATMRHAHRVRFSRGREARMAGRER
jgi:hypothetical protein